jgi:DNA-binding response OmpR family regulator
MEDKNAAKRILIVEDEKEMADLIAKVLTKEGYSVEVAYDGEEGLSKITGSRPDLVLLDVMMPKMDGRDLLKKVKSSGETKDIPIVIVSARSEQWDRDIGLQLGAEEYIEKPLEVVKLLRQIKNIFKKKEEKAG